MNYQLGIDGKVVGTYSLEELRARRSAGQLSGTEYVLKEGGNEWQLLDSLLQTGSRPEAVRPAEKKKFNQTLAWILAGIATMFLLIVIAAVVLAIVLVRRGRDGRETASMESVPENITESVAENAARAEALEAASKPIVISTNSWTQKDVHRYEQQFRGRQWLEEYKQRSEHGFAWDADAQKMIEAWISKNFAGTSPAPGTPTDVELSAKLAANPKCNDPLLLTVMAAIDIRGVEKNQLLKRAVKGFENSPHRAYPKFYAAALLARYGTMTKAKRVEVENLAVSRLGEALADGSLLPSDQEEIANILMEGWGTTLYTRNSAAVISTVENAGSNFAWLALTLKGKQEVNLAWKARGTGFADKVSEEGWAGFASHLEMARSELTEAWNLHPEFPMAPAEMITVAMGNSDVQQMRLWFDRSIAARADFSPAWSSFRWGLRPRWGGDEKAMLAFGLVALNTGRFDTDIPDNFFHSITDMASEENLGPGLYIYGRPEIWPPLQKMYEGYIAQHASDRDSNNWRSSYAEIAYLGGKYEVVREQFEAMNWQPPTNSFTRVPVERNLIPLEIAARTSSASNEISRAELSRARLNLSDSLAVYEAVGKSKNLDARTLAFVNSRIASLKSEQALQANEWVDYQPKSLDDPNWVFISGTPKFLADGALEIESGHGGHLLYSRARVGWNFEVRGEMEFVKSSTHSFQAGIVMGLPDLSNNQWNTFRIKQNDNQAGEVSIGYGWSTNEVTQSTRLNPATNTFYLRCEARDFTASVNDHQLVNNVAQPGTTPISDNALIGLGAYNGTNTTVIRYRHIQVRLLPSKTIEAKR